MKTKHWIITTLFISSTALAGTYNFYFYDDEGKPRTEEETQEPKAVRGEDVNSVSSRANSEGSQDPSNQELTDEKISQLADEVAKRINKNEPQQPAQIVQTVQSIPASKDEFHFISRDRYLAFGVGMESPFVQDGEIIKDPLAYGKESYFIRAKFFPLIGFEGALSDKEKTGSAYRVAAFTEFNLTKYTALHFMGGVMENPTVYFLNNDKKQKTISYDDRPYGGIGLKFRLFSRVDLSGSMNMVANKDIGPIKNSKNRKEFLDSFKPFYTIGASFVF